MAAPAGKSRKRIIGKGGGALKKTRITVEEPPVSTIPVANEIPTAARNQPAEEVFDTTAHATECGDVRVDSSPSSSDQEMELPPSLFAGWSVSCHKYF